MPKAKYPEIEEIKKDIDSLKENTIELSKHVKKQGSLKKQELKGAAVEQIDSLRETGQDQISTLVEEVKNKPLQSIAVAAAAGALVGILFGRR